MPARRRWASTWDRVSSPEQVEAPSAVAAALLAMGHHRCSR